MKAIANERKPQGLQAKMFLTTDSSCKSSPNGYKVFEGFGHLEALNGQVTSMQEVVDPLLAAAAVVVCLGLGQLVIMVGKA